MNTHWVALHLCRLLSQYPLGCTQGWSWICPSPWLMAFSFLRCVCPTVIYNLSVCHLSACSKSSWISRQKLNIERKCHNLSVICCVGCQGHSFDSLGELVLVKCVPYHYFILINVCAKWRSHTLKIISWSHNVMVSVEIGNAFLYNIHLLCQHCNKSKCP